MTEDPYSRLRLAGYDPECLHQRKALIAGAGSLAQPLGETLVLSGIGDMRIVDLDQFMPHNRAKSSHYPHHLRDATARDLPYKAEFVANSLARRATAPGGAVRYANAWVQALGTAVVREVDVVVSCVDAVPARSWLAKTALQHNRPLVTGGFAANHMWYAVYPAVGLPEDRPCWNCTGTRETDVFSCRHYAEAAAKDDIIPAIQTAAVALSGFMAEAAIMLLHDREPAARSVVLDLRTGETTVSRPLPDPECAKRHRLAAVDVEVDVDPATGTLADVAARLDEAVIFVALPFPLVSSAACRVCARTTSVDAALFAWEAQPYCEAHDGPWPRTGDETLKVPPMSISEVRPRDAMWNVPMSKLGIAPGEVIALRTRAGARHVRLAGAVTERLAVAVP